MVNALVINSLQRYSQLQYKTPENTQRKFEYFQSLGMNSFQLNKLVSRSPTLLGLSVEGNILPRIDLFRNLGFTEEMILKIVSRSPNVMTICATTTLLQRFQYLSRMVDSPSFHHLITVNPQMLLYSIERWDTLKAFLKSSLGIAEKDVGRVVCLAPRIVGLSLVDNLGPKVELLISLLTDEALRNGLPKQQAREMGKIAARELILRMPAYFGFSLSDRLLPRFTALRKEERSLFMVFLRCTNENFDKYIYGTKAVLGKPVMEVVAKARLKAAVAQQEELEEPKETFKRQKGQKPPEETMEAAAMSEKPTLEEPLRRRLSRIKSA